MWDVITAMVVAGTPGTTVLGRASHSSAGSHGVDREPVAVLADAVAREGLPRRGGDDRVRARSLSLAMLQRLGVAGATYGP